MDDLRWILLAVAVVIIAAVFFLSRSKKKDKTTLLRDAADEIPSFSANDSLEGEYDENRSNSGGDTDWVDSVGPVRVVSEADQQSFFDENDDWSDSQIDEVEQEQQPEAEPEIVLEHLSEPEILSVTSSPARPPVTFEGLASENTPEEGLPEVCLPEKQQSEQQSERIELSPPLPSESSPERINVQERLPDQQPDVVVAPHSQKKTLSETKDTTTDLEDPGSDTVDNESDSDENASAEDDVIAVYVLATKEEPVINGDKILSASYALHLQHGDMKVFHRIQEVSVGGVVKDEIQFSMANLLEPGWFDIENMNQLETAGLSFFMQVNLVKNPSAVLDEMLICAHKMSAMLGAKLCSAQRQLLDETYTTHLRNKVKRLVKAQKAL